MYAISCLSGGGGFIAQFYGNQSTPISAIESTLCSYSLVPRLSLQAMESWVGPGNEAIV